MQDHLDELFCLNDVLLDAVESLGKQKHLCCGEDVSAKTNNLGVIKIARNNVEEEVRRAKNLIALSEKIIGNASQALEAAQASDGKVRKHSPRFTIVR